MEIEELPLVRIGSKQPREYKYIVATIKDPNNVTVRTVLWSKEHGRDFVVHTEILHEIERALDKKYKVECLGGGFLTHDESVKKIKLHGSSDTYGAEKDRSVSAKILREKFSDHQVEFEKGHTKYF